MSRWTSWQCLVLAMLASIVGVIIRGDDPLGAVLMGVVALSCVVMGWRASVRESKEAPDG